MGQYTVDIVSAIRALEACSNILANEYPEAVERLDFVKDALVQAQIVRCGECKHWHRETGYCELHSYFHDSDGLCCSPAESQEWTMWDENDFCSDGEKENSNGKKATAD